MSMVDVNEHRVLEILRQTIRQSADHQQSVLSPVLLDIVTKMTDSMERIIDLVLQCIDDVYADYRDRMLPGILLILSSRSNDVYFGDKENWNFIYDGDLKILSFYSIFTMPRMAIPEVRVGSMNDLQAMEIIMRYHSVPEPYIQSIVSVFRERFESKDMHSPHTISSTNQPTASLSLAGHVARYLLREHIHELDASDVAQIIDVDVLRNALLEFLKQDRISNMVRVLRSIPLCFSPLHFPGTSRELRIYAEYWEKIVVKERLETKDKTLRIEFEETLSDDKNTFDKSIYVLIYIQPDGSNVHTQTLDTDLGSTSMEWRMERNKPAEMAKTFDSFRQMQMSENMLRWLRVRIMYFLHSPPALYQVTLGNHSTFSLADSCPDMSTNRTFSSEEDGPNKPKCVKISLSCWHETLYVTVVFECRLFVQKTARGQEAMYDRVVKVRISQLENDCDDLMRALPNVFVSCDISEEFLEWTLPQDADEGQRERTLMVLGHSGCGHDTLLWMKRQFAIFLNAPSSEARRVYDTAS